MEHRGADPRPLAALACAVEIGSEINRLSAADPAGVQVTLRLIVESAIEIIPGASGVIYAYDSRRGAFDPASRVAAGEPAGASVDDFPRAGGLGARAITELRPVLSYAEPDLDIHPAKQAAGARIVACLPLIVARQVVGALYLYLQEQRRLTQLELLLLNNFVNQAAMAIFHASRLADVQRDLARKQDELGRLRHAGLLISSRTRLDETLEVILQMGLEVTGARYGILRLVDKAGQNLLARAIVGERLGQPAIEVLPIAETSIMGYVALMRTPLCIPDVRLPPWSHIYYPLDRSLEMRAELAVPLIGAGGRLEGVLNLESPTPAAFSDDDSRLLQTLATQAVIAIQEVRLLDALQEMAGRLPTQPCQEVLDHLTTLACDLLNTADSAIFILDGEQLIVRAATAGHVRGELAPARGSIMGQAFVSGGHVTSSDVQDDPLYGTSELARSQGWSAALAVPLLSANDSQAMGVLVAYWGSQGTRSAPGATDWDKKVLTLLAHYAALAVRNEADQAALRVAQEQRAMAETFAAVGDVAANLLHRLNNKVGAIPVRVEGIEDKRAPLLAADSYLATNLREIERSAREAMEAVRQSLAHLQSMPLAPVRVADCVAEALASSQLSDTMHVQVSGLAELPPVLAHPRGLALVFSNLLENATDAMDGAGAVTIRGQSRGRWVEVSVGDSGPGIPPELHERIFELNFSGRRGSRPNKLGFGLWWVRTLMTRLGGTISVASDGQAGAHFCLRLPCVEE